MKKMRWSETFRKPPFFLRLETYLRPGDQPISSDENSRDPRIVPLVILDYGSLSAKLRQMRSIMRMVLLSIRNMWQGIKSVRQNPRKGQVLIDQQSLHELERFAKARGICDIGYTRVNRSHIFKGFKILYANAIVFTIEMDKLKIKSAPSPDSLKAVWSSYYQIGVVVNEVCDFLRARGFNAYPGHAIGGDVQYIPLAIDAGLGYSGKNGLLITRKNGPRIRLAAVFTDIANLPFANENPHKWVRDFCDSCNNCIKKCPADAIYDQPKADASGAPVFIDHTKCAVPFSNDNGCTLCIKFCPFSFGEYELIKEQHEKAIRKRR